MEQIHDRVAGLDVHRDSVTACFRQLGPKGGVSYEKQQFSTTTAGLELLCGWLAERRVDLVAMESTGVYWKSPYYALERHFTVWLCNARHVKKVPGRKTDMSDAEWLADVAAHGMVRPSFVPPPPIRELRELTRYRKTQIDARVAEIQRLEKVLQDAGIKLTSVASKVLTQSGRAMIEALIAGERDPAALAGLAKGKLRPKIPALTEALVGHFGAHHAVAAGRILDHLDFLDETIRALSEQIDARTAAFGPVYELLLPVPGLDRPSIDVIVAETGADMSRFPTAGDLASWAGVCPGNYESAGKRRRVSTTHGNHWLRRTLIEAARAAVRTKGSYFGAQYRQIARRRGPNKAAMAVAHSLVELIWHLLTTGEVFEDLGDDYFQTRRDPQRQARRLVAQLEDLGFTVTTKPDLSGLRPDPWRAPRSATEERISPQIEHRLFSFISINWRGKPLTTYRTVVELIAATTTRTGLKVQADLDTGYYPLGQKVTDAELAAVPLEPHTWHPNWNYSIRPP
jgi:transposase